MIVSLALSKNSASRGAMVYGTCSLDSYNTSSTVRCDPVQCGAVGSGVKYEYGTSTVRLRTRDRSKMIDSMLFFTFESSS